MRSGGTAGRTCDPVGVSRFCVPGCYQFDREGGGPGWCDEGSAGGTSCAFKPTHMVDMLEAQRAVPQAGGVPVYNEVRARSIVALCTRRRAGALHSLQLACQERVVPCAMRR